MKNKKRNSLAWILALLVGILLVLLVAALALAPSYWLRPKTEEAGDAACANCHLEIGALAWQFSPFGLRADQVRFHAGDPRDSAVTIAARSVGVPIPLRDVLSRGPWRLGVVALEGLDVTVHEGDALLPSESSGAAAGGGGVWIEGIEARGATFTYRKDSPGGQARLRLTPIAVVAGGFGTGPSDRDRPLLARAEATLEHSGAVTLAVSANYFGRPAFADVDLHLDGQKLREVNGYFRPEEGVELKGDLVHSHGLVRVRGRKADGVLTARFTGLSVKFRANRHRGGLAAFLDNVGAGLLLKDGNLGDPLHEAVRTVHTLRRPRESAVGFVLRTLLEAGMKVVKK